MGWLDTSLIRNFLLDPNEPTWHDPLLLLSNFRLLFDGLTTTNAIFISPTWWSEKLYTLWEESTYVQLSNMYIGLYNQLHEKVNQWIVFCSGLDDRSYCWWSYIWRIFFENNFSVLVINKCDFFVTWLGQLEVVKLMKMNGKQTPISEMDLDIGVSVVFSILGIYSDESLRKIFYKLESCFGNMQWVTVVPVRCDWSYKPRCMENFRKNKYRIYTS